VVRTTHEALGISHGNHCLRPQAGPLFPVLPYICTILSSSPLPSPSSLPHLAPYVQHTRLYSRSLYPAAYKLAVPKMCCVQSTCQARSLTPGPGQPCDPGDMLAMAAVSHGGHLPSHSGWIPLTCPVLLKDRPQEVKETLLPRKCPSASERYLCPQAMHKKAIKPNPHPDPWDHRFPGPPVCPTM
jgi:hypothetical protein